MVDDVGRGGADDVLVLGEALVDVVRTADGVVTERPGGSAANVAVALARLGRPVRFATAYADDERGAVLAQHLEAAGVDLAGDPHVLARTASAQATIGTDGSASYTFDLDWRLGPVEVGTPRFVHVCSIGAVTAPGADDVVAVLESLPATSTVLYDVNARPAITGTGPALVEAVERVLRRAHLVKVSDEDLEAVYPDLASAAAVERILDLGPRTVAVTRGGDGADWVSAAGTVSVASEPVRVADTIGAGDTFAAALVDALWDDVDRDPAQVLAHAARAAAVTVGRPGADPPWRHELA
ncbi:PfkB family carbohydrate kinase [Nocardioides nanhaiensis]|uniref:Carbohydrate kinase n=1 Tax=Nocardioides nanhaiensis TaxID=1476871 RepID=A0ABP8VXK2_9ACTN